MHGDTQAQSLPVFALAHLLGIKLMPRIRQLINLVFSRAEPKHKCEHIEALFKDDINWKLIETNFLEMLRVAVSIKLGVITSSSILRRLGTHSRKNPLYFAFRELGKVIRTLFMLEYVDDLEVRKMIQAATNRARAIQSIREVGVLRWRGHHRREHPARTKQVGEVRHLVANLIILHNVNEMTRVIGELQQEGMTFTDEVLGGLSPYRMGHINRFGDYTVDVSRSPVKTFADSEMRMPAAA